MTDTETLMDFAARSGACLIESGAETRRVEDTLNRIIRHFYGGYSEVFVMLTGFLITVGDYTQTVRVSRISINLGKVAAINTLSRQITAGYLTLDGASARLDEILDEKPYPFAVKTLFAALCCGFFTLLYGGGIFDALNSFLVGAAAGVLTQLLRRHGSAEFIVTFCGGALIALLTTLFCAIGLGAKMNVMINGAIMPFVPGLAVTNALRDIIEGDYISGGARMLDALVTAAALAAGAGSIMYLMGFLSGGLIL